MSMHYNLANEQKQYTNILSFREVIRSSKGVQMLLWTLIIKSNSH